MKSEEKEEEPARKQTDLRHSHTPGGQREQVFNVVSDIKEKTSPVSAKASARQLIAMELLQTEKNYVGILNTILKVRKEDHVTSEVKATSTLNKTTRMLVSIESRPLLL